MLGELLGDGSANRFSTNHLRAPQLLRGGGGPSGEDRSAHWTLPQDPVGLEAQHRKPGNSKLWLENTMVWVQSSRSWSWTRKRWPGPSTQAASTFLSDFVRTTGGFPWWCDRQSAQGVIGPKHAGGRPAPASGEGRVREGPPDAAYRTGGWFLRRWHRTKRGRSGC